MVKQCKWPDPQLFLNGTLRWDILYAYKVNSKQDKVISIYIHTEYVQDNVYFNGNPYSLHSLSINTITFFQHTLFHQSMNKNMHYLLRDDVHTFLCNSTTHTHPHSLECNCVCMSYGWFTVLLVKIYNFEVIDQVNIIVLGSHLCCSPVNLMVVSSLRMDLRPVAGVPPLPVIKALTRLLLPDLLSMRSGVSLLRGQLHNFRCCGNVLRIGHVTRIEKAEINTTPLLYSAKYW